MPMPIEVVVTYQDGSKEMLYLPLEMMRGEKVAESGSPVRVMSVDWPWTHPTKTLTLAKPFASIKSVEIDPSKRMADIQPENNKVEF
jgi:hypothetical protein